MRLDVYVVYAPSGSLFDFCLELGPGLMLIIILLRLRPPLLLDVIRSPPLSNPCLRAKDPRDTRQVLARCLCLRCKAWVVLLQDLQRHAIKLSGSVSSAAYTCFTLVLPDPRKMKETTEPGLLTFERLAREQDLFKEFPQKS